MDLYHSGAPLSQTPVGNIQMSSSQRWICTIKHILGHFKVSLLQGHPRSYLDAKRVAMWFVDYNDITVTQAHINLLVSECSCVIIIIRSVTMDIHVDHVQML